MGTTCLTVCPECSRHGRCDERACPFCGARVTSYLRVLEYRLKTRLNRGQSLSLGAALTAVGIASLGNDAGCISAYGAPCMRNDTCDVGGSVGSPSAGSAGRGGSAGATGASGLAGSIATTGGSDHGGNGAAGTNGSGANPAGGNGGNPTGGGSTNGNPTGGSAGSISGTAGESAAGAGGDGGASGDGGAR